MTAIRIVGQFREYTTNIIIWPDDSETDAYIIPLLFFSVNI